MRSRNVVCRFLLFLLLQACGAGLSGHGSGSSSNDENGDSPQADHDWITFAAGFDSGGICGDEPASGPGGAGCDIYRASLDATSFEVLSIDRLTTSGDAEVFPSIAADGSKVYFHTVDSISARSLYVVDADTLDRTLLSSAAEYADSLPDGRVAFTDMSQGNLLSVLTLNAAGTSIDSREALVSEKPSLDANFTADGKFAVFHVSGSGANHGVHVLDVDAGTTTQVTDASGIGHCTISPTHTRVICDNANGSGLAGWTFTAGEWIGGEIAVGDPTDLASSDPDYSGCAITSADFPAFCDETHLLLSVSCVIDGATSFSKVFLADLESSPATLRAIGVELAAASGGTGATSWTPSCRPASD